MITVWESDDSTDRFLLPKVLRRLFYKGRRDADRRSLKFYRVIADLFDLFPGRRLF